MCIRDRYTVVTLPCEIQKESFFNSIIHTFFRLFTLSQKKTNCYPLLTTSENYHHTTLQHAQFFIFFIFLRVSSTNPWYGRVAEASCCDMGWISAGRGGQCSWSVAKKTESMYPCRNWSLWTLAVTLLAWHSICRTSQPVLFRATNANPQTDFFRASLSHQRLEECNLPSGQIKKLCILQRQWGYIFQVCWVRR